MQETKNPSSMRGMSDVDKALQVVFAHEGGDTGPGGLPNDPGGRTKYGYSLAQMKVEGWDVDGDGDVDEDDVVALTPELVRERYKKKYWVPIRGDQIFSQDVATKFLDIAVHTGPARAILIMQRAVNQVSRIRIKADGKMGPMTIAAINAADTLPLLVAISMQQAAFYGAIFEQNPKMEQYRKNWLTRAAWPLNNKVGNG